MELYTKTINGVEVSLMRIADHLGYYFELNGHRYGAYAIAGGDDFKPHFETLEQNAKETIESLTQ